MGILSPEGIHHVVVEALEQRLRDLELETDEVDGNFALFDSGALDSIGFVELMTGIEQKLGQQFDLGELDFDRLETLDALVAQLCRLMHR